MKLSLPDGWIIDSLAAFRLEHQLATASELIGSVVAPLTPLPPGASYRTLAEHLSLRPLDAVRRHPADAEPPFGARLHRDARDRGSSPMCLVDSGAATHDPSSVDRELLVASPIGRSPFPRRPVVALVGVDPTGAVLDRAHLLTDALIALEIEARLVVGRFPIGTHLTRPCLADLRSLQILRPQVVVVLDAPGHDLAETWYRESRATSLVGLDPDATTGIVLRSGPDDPPGSPYRACIHPDTPPDSLAELFRRLVAGPQPGPPTTVSAHTAVQVTSGPTRRRPATIRSVGLWAGVLDRAGRERLDGLADRLRAGGDTAVRGDGVGDATTLERADVLVLRGLATTPELLELIARRRAAARPTIVDLSADDLGSSPSTFGLSTDILPIVQASRLASTPSEAWCTELRTAGYSAHRLPTLRRPDARRGAEVQLVDAPRTITWVLDPCDDHPPAAAAVEEALRSMLAKRPGTRVVVCGDPRRWPPPLELGRDSARVDEPDASLLAETTLFVWTPDRRRASADGSPTWLVRAAEREIPTLIDRIGPDDTSALVPPDATIDRADDPGRWRATIEWLLDDDIALRTIGADAGRLARDAMADAQGERALQALLTWALSRARTLADGGGPG